VPKDVEHKFRRQFQNVVLAARMLCLFRSSPRKPRVATGFEATFRCLNENWHVENVPDIRVTTWERDEPK
jgi:hypothetical protein